MNEFKLDKHAPLFIENIEDVLQTLYNQFRAIKVQNDRLREENDRLKSESYKDEELVKMKSEYDRMKEDYFRGFPISEEDDEKIKQWMREKMKDGFKAGAIGGRFTYHFTPTGIGTIGSIVDTFTDDKFVFREL